MGGHGGLNILPQKRWNVYNFDNREKVKKDEEAAAKEEQLQREQSRKRDTELRLEQLRTARGLAPTITPPSTSTPPPSAVASVASDAKHINLFDGIKILDLIDGPGKRKADAEADGRKKKMLKMMREKAPETRVVTEEDEKYRLGYGVVGKGAKLPWYAANPSNGANKGGSSSPDSDKSWSGKHAKKSGGKKTIEELREERLSRESREKARTQALIQDKNRKDVAMPKDRYFSKR